MSTVVNSGALLDQFGKLGWTTGINDLLAAAFSAGIPASVVSLYLAALITSPASLNDQTISGVTGVQGTAITAFLKNRGLVGT